HVVTEYIPFRELLLRPTDLVEIADAQRSTARDIDRAVAPRFLELGKLIQKVPGSWFLVPGSWFLVRDSRVNFGTWNAGTWHAGTWNLGTSHPFARHVQSRFGLA